MKLHLLACITILVLSTPALTATDDPTQSPYLGKPAPELIASGWVGLPVSLSAVRGNTVVLVFWNADIPC